MWKLSDCVRVCERLLGMLFQAVQVSEALAQEALRAERAGVGRRALVGGVAVRGQLGPVQEGGGAVGAGAGGHAGVEQLVLPQVGRLAEGAVAHGAAVRAHAGVCERVPRQVGEGREGLAALAALEGALARVRAQVVAHVDLLLEGLVAHAALEEALGHVDRPAVAHQTQLRGERLGARPARERRLGRGGGGRGFRSALPGGVASALFRTHAVLFGAVAMSEVQPSCSAQC